MSWFRFLLILMLPAAALARWPQFRGVNATGVALESDMPVHFSPQSNLLWKAAVPGGHSSPILAGNRIFVTGFENGELQTLCLDRKDGGLLWKHGVAPVKIEHGARNSHPATSTPCTDGTNIYSYFGSYGAIAYDLRGVELWRTPLPVPITQHGASSSPVLAGNVIILQRDADFDSHLLALNKKDGAVAWRTDRPDARRSFSTPLVFRDETSDHCSVIVAGTLRVAAFDSRSGAEIWTVPGLPNEMCSSPVAAEGLLFVAGWTPGSGVAVLPGFDSLLERGDADHDGKLTRTEAPSGPAKQHFLYIDANKDGFITRQEWNTMSEIFSKSKNAALAIQPNSDGTEKPPRVLWKHDRGLPYVPTPLAYEHRVYLIRNGGLLTCLNATNGAPFYQEERIGAIGDYYSSPVAAHGKICVISQAGTATILAAGDHLNILARNALGEPVLATPAIEENVLYIRTETALCAFSAKP